MSSKLSRRFLDQNLSAFVLATILLTTALAGCAFSQQSGRVIKDIQYIEDGSHDHQLDLYLPTKGTFNEKKGAPLIVWIHGGGWELGDKAVIPDGKLVESSYAVATINYRLTKNDNAVFPAQIEDCKTAIRWLRKHASEYGIDSKKIGVWGASAGGHLVLLLGLTKDDQFKTKDYPEYSSQVQAVCDWSGPTDFFTISQQAGDKDQLSIRSPRGPVAKLFGGFIDDHKDLAKMASPVTYVKAKCPPILIVHGAQDHTVPPQQSEEILKDLKAVGANVELLSLPDKGHNVGCPESFAKTRSFFDQYLKGTSSK